MKKDDRPDDSAEKPGFAALLLRGVLRDLVAMMVAFAIGTAAGAVICAALSLPMVLSLLGGVAVMGLYLAWDRF